MNLTSEIVMSIRANLYLLTPEETYHKDFSKIPNIITKAIPMLLVYMFTEIMVHMAKGRMDNYRLGNTVVNWMAVSFTEPFMNFIFRGAEMSAYIWVFENWRFQELPWDSPWTYVAAILMVDCLAYWWHRACHEISFMWAAHYVHHSSEDLNASTAARVSVTMRPFKWLYFLPLAFIGLPPPTMLIHMQLGLVYTSWTHCEMFPKLSSVIPVVGHLLEFIIITPSHHRVHHGVNHYCIDKNYGQVLIIWDRIFGTFAEERDDELLTYGTVGQRGTYNIVAMQFYPWIELWQKMQSMTTVGDKVRALVYGPGWTPGKPRLGELSDIPDVRGRKKWDAELPAFVNTYLVFNCALVMYSYVEMMTRINFVSDFLLLVNLFYITLALTSLGGLYDCHRYAAILEPVRILVFLALATRLSMFGSSAVTTFVCWANVSSLLVCPAVAAYTFNRSAKKTV